jgi:hypothetical protein
VSRTENAYTFIHCTFALTSFYIHHTYNCIFLLWPFWIMIACCSRGVSYLHLGGTHCLHSCRWREVCSSSMMVLIYYTKTLCLILECHSMNLYHRENYVFYASYQAFKSVKLRSLFFWDVTLCHWVRGSQHFHVMHWSHHQESKHPTRL